MELIRQAPKKIKYRQDNRTPSSDSQNAGQTLHSFTLGGAVAEIMPFKDKRTKAAKDWWSDCEKRGNIPLRSEDDAIDINNAAVEARRAIWERFRRYPTDPGCHAEQTLQWTSETGAACEGTPDLVICFPGEVWIIELKSWDDIPTFKRSVIMKGWDIQRAGYIEAVKLANPACIVQHEFLVQELKAPYLNTWIAPVKDAHDYGAMRWRKASREFASLESGGFWDCGYSPHTYDLSAWERLELEAG